MKASIDQKDLHYTPFAHMVRAVYLNGELQTYVVSFDTDAGEIVVYDYSEFNISLATIPKRKLKGVVTVSLGDKLEYRNGKIELARP